MRRFTPLIASVCLSAVAAGCRYEPAAHTTVVEQPTAEQPVVSQQVEPTYDDQAYENQDYEQYDYDQPYAYEEPYTAEPASGVYYGEAPVRQNIVVFRAPPPLVYVEPDVYVVENVAAPVYFVGGSYWQVRSGHWYHASHWDDPWVSVNINVVPRTVIHRDHHHYVHYRPPARTEVWREPRYHSRADTRRVSAPRLERVPVRARPVEHRAVTRPAPAPPPPRATPRVAPPRRIAPPQRASEPQRREPPRQVTPQRRIERPAAPVRVQQEQRPAPPPKVAPPRREAPKVAPPPQRERAAPPPKVDERRIRPIRHPRTEAADKDRARQQQEEKAREEQRREEQRKKQQQRGKEKDKGKKKPRPQA